MKPLWARFYANRWWTLGLGIVGLMALFLLAASLNYLDFKPVSITFLCLGNLSRFLTLLGFGYWIGVRSRSQRGNLPQELILIKFAARLERAGLPAESVQRPTRLFEKVRYGGFEFQGASAAFGHPLVWQNIGG
jgi:hypothetical protein